MNFINTLFQFYYKTKNSKNIILFQELKVRINYIYYLLLIYRKFMNHILLDLKENSNELFFVNPC